TSSDEALWHFRHSASREHFAILAYCLMPDHAHLLIEGLDDGSDLRRFAKAAKQSSGFAHARRVGRPLWQEGYFDRALRKDEDMKTIARYILQNPVRAGLVAHPSEYRFSGSDLWTMAELLEGCQ